MRKSTRGQRTVSRPDSKSKGRILYIGVSYYNNWYLSRELRKLGWKADVLTYFGGGTESYLHGSDYELNNYINWDNEYNKKDFDFLNNLLKKYIELDDNKQSSPKPQNSIDLIKLVQPFVNLILKRGPERIQPYVIDRWGCKIEKFIIKSLVECQNLELLKNLIRHFIKSMRKTHLRELEPFFNVLDYYDILHFTGVNNLRYFYFLNPHLFGSMPIEWDIKLLKRINKKIVYSNTGCLDGVSQSSFRAWPPEPVCDICRWRSEPGVCSDEKNLAWGKLRNSLADYQITSGGNRADYNSDPNIHEVPEFYCLDPDIWKPGLEIPPTHQMQFPEGTIKIYHAVGNYDFRTHSNGVNIKCTHIYLPLIERLKKEGYKVDIIFIKDIPNKEVRFYQAQADLVVDMLTFGWFGANIREGMMLGKPCVCFLRPEWLQSMRNEIPEYVDELPVINATPDTVYQVLKDLLEHPEKRQRIGQKSRQFALKWHSSESGAKRLEKIYSDLLRS
jgi:hypothetical protein